MSNPSKIGKLIKDDILFSIAIASLCYILIFPLQFLNPFSDEWIAGNGDFHTHYLGWLSFYHSHLFQWPIFAVDAYGEGIAKGIVYTDSIPIAALFAKLLGKILNLGDFQYFGLFILLSFVLQHYFSFLYLKKLSRNIPISRLMAICFLIFPPLLYRCQGHTALTAQWIIIVSLLLFEYRTQIWPWIAMSFLTLGIHFYIFVMVTFLFTAYILERRLQLAKSPWKLFIYLILYLAISAFALFFYGYIPFLPSDATFSGYGEFTFNLLSPFSTAGGFSHIIPELPLRYGALEGISYPGLAIYGLVVALIFTPTTRRLGKPNIISRHKILWLFLIGAWAFSVSPIVSAGTYSVNLGRLPWPLFIFGDILRASGRLSLPLIYYLFLNIVAAYILRLKEVPSKSPKLFVFTALPVTAALLYLCDVGAFSMKLRTNLRKQVASNPVSARVHDLSVVFGRLGYDSYSQQARRRIRFYPVTEAPEQWNVFAQYAAENGWKTNGVYLARYDEKQMAKQNSSIGLELKARALKIDTVYVIDSDSGLAKSLVSHFPPCFEVDAVNQSTSKHCYYVYESKALFIPPASSAL
jgi:hypothetical protein